MPETRETLRHMIRHRLQKGPFVVVSNREPYLSTRRGGRTEWVRAVSGVTAALDSVMRASQGLWVAHGSGSADFDVADKDGFVGVPPNRPAYRLKRVRLTPRQVAGYYNGFANSTLWPLCHVAYQRPVFRYEQWEIYREVNQLFAQSVAEEIQDSRAFVFIQDYHLALLPRMLRLLCPRAQLVQFWHIPWPNPEVMRICPWTHEILEGLLGNEILGFHIRYHCDNFIATVERELEARPDRERNAIVYRGHATKIRAFPISVDFEEISRQAGAPETQRLMASLRREYHLSQDKIVGLGVDRIDYTKGLGERLDALDALLERHPRYRGRLVFLQVGVPSRTELPEYRALGTMLRRKVAAINRKYRRRGWEPVIFLRQALPLATLVALYRLADFLVASSLHDGMNLVAKEFVAARVDGRGVLLLSRFTGASRELRDALLINSFVPEEMAGQMRDALEMDPLEIRRRMGRLRNQVREHNVYDWAAGILRKGFKLG